MAQSKSIGEWQEWVKSCNESGQSLGGKRIDLNVSLTFLYYDASHPGRKGSLPI